jgi:diacylglycerol kinase (ATP)
MKIETYYIMNPKSGTTSQAKKNKIISYIRHQKNTVLLETAHAGHATDLAREAVQQGAQKVVAVGGDGTVNEVASGLLNSTAALGIVPIGSGNGLARHLGVPMNPFAAIKNIKNATIQPIDACFLNEMPFFCTAGIGFDAEVAHLFAQQKKRGILTYIKSTFACFFSYQNTSLSLSIEGQSSQSLDVFSLTLANACQFGNNAYIAPGADIADGQIEVCWLKPLSTWQALVHGFRLFAGTLPNSSLYTRILATQVRLHKPGPITIHLDGEPLRLDTDELEIKVSAGVLNVCRNF